MGAGLLRSSGARTLLCGFAGLMALFFTVSAQSPPPVQPPSPQPQPPIIRQPQLSIEVNPGSGPVIIGPNGVITSPAGDDVAPAASAAFDPPTGRVGRPVEYRITITGSQRVVELPVPNGPGQLTIEQGSRSFSMQPLNGQLVNKSTLNYVVTASEPGEFTIPAHTVDVGGKKVLVPAASLVVRESQQGEEAYQPARAFIELPERDFFIGETVSGRLLIPGTADEMPQYVQHVAKTSGAVLFKASMRTRREQFMLDGKQQTGLVMPIEVTPILAGESAVNCELVVHVARGGGKGRQLGFTSQSTLVTPDVKLRARVVPEIGRPAGFTGAIGKFTISQPKLSAEEAEVGEPVTLTVSLRGTGNLDSVPAPELPEGGDWTSYRPTSQVETDASGDAVTKTFTFTLVPKRDGRKGTPPLPFAYFDPDKGAFVDVSIPPVPVVVKPSPDAPAVPLDDRANAAEPREPPREAEPALTGLAERPGSWSGSPRSLLSQFLVAQIVPPVVLLLVWAWRKRKEFLATHPEIRRRRRAHAAARRALAAARAAVRRGDQAAFFNAGVGALREAASPLDTTEAGSLTREEVLSRLRDDDAAAGAALAVFENAEAARYAGGAAPMPEVAALLPALERAVKRLEVKS